MVVHGSARHARMESNLYGSGSVGLVILGRNVAGHWKSMKQEAAQGNWVCPRGLSGKVK